MRATTVDDPAQRSEKLYTPAFVLLLLAQSCYGMSFSTFFLLPKYLKVALAASDVQIGAAGAISSIAGVIAFPFVGSLNDRFGRKRFMLIGSAVMTSLALVMPLFPEVSVWFYLSRLGHGLSFALFYNSATTLASDRVRPERLGVALGVFGSSVLITNALAPALAELISNQFDWRTVFWIAAAWGAVSLVLTSLVREPAHSASDTPAVSAYSMLREPRARAIVLAIAGAGAGFGTAFTFYQPYALSLGMTQIAGFFVAYASTALFGRMLLLARIDRLNRQTVSAVATLLYAIAVAGIAWLRPVLLETIGAVLGVAHGVLYPIFNALALAKVRPHERGSMMALYHGGFNAGMAAALLLGGAIAQRLSYPWLFWLTATWTATSALLLWRSPLLKDERPRP